MQYSSFKSEECWMSFLFCLFGHQLAYFMSDRKPGIVPEYARAGIAHHLPDLFAHIGLVAMYGAIFACRFPVSVRASVKPLECVFLQGIALSAGQSMMMSTAVNRDHGSHSFLFDLNHTQPPVQPFHHPHSRSDFGLALDHAEQHFEPDRRR